MRLTVKPVYGNGWSRAGATIDTPPSFHLDVEIVIPGEPFEILGGTMETPGHLLTGLWILLSPRHMPFDGSCNLAAFTQKPKDANWAEADVAGYGQIEEV